MFCEKCGKEVDEKWRVCPHCGAQINNSNNTEETVMISAKNGEKKNKVKKPIFKRVWFWILIVICGIFIVSVIGGSGEEATKAEKKQEVVDLDDIGGFEQWEENGFKEKVRTIVTVYFPLENVERNNYAVLADGKSVVVLQEDEAPISEWEWLQNVDDTDIIGNDPGYVLYEATLEYLGQKETDKFPVFIISDVEKY